MRPFYLGLNVLIPQSNMYWETYIKPSVEWISQKWLSKKNPTKHTYSITPWVGVWVWAWWRHQMEAFSALLVLCAGNSPVTGDFPAQRPVTHSFDIFFDLRLNKQLNKQSRRWWFETTSHPLRHQCNGKCRSKMAEPPDCGKRMNNMERHVVLSKPPNYIGSNPTTFFRTGPLRQ